MSRYTVHRHPYCAVPLRTRRSEDSDTSTVTPSSASSSPTSPTSQSSLHSRGSHWQNKSTRGMDPAVDEPLPPYTPRDYYQTSHSSRDADAMLHSDADRKKRRMSRPLPHPPTPTTTTNFSRPLSMQRVRRLPMPPSQMRLPGAPEEEEDVEESDAWPNPGKDSELRPPEQIMVDWDLIDEVLCGEFQ